MGRVGGPTLAPVTARPEFLNEQGLIFGTSYTSRAVVSDGTQPAPTADPITQYTPSGRPGGRAPHVWLERNGQRQSTIDLMGGFVLMTGAAGQAWAEAAGTLRSTLDLPFQTYIIGGAGAVDPEGHWNTIYGVDEEGAVLVRPDGHVGWRSKSATPAPLGVLSTALRRILGKSL